MRTGRTLAALVLAALGACGPGSTTPAVPEIGTRPAGAVTYGKVSAQAEAVAIDELIAHPADWEGKVVQVQGTITDVCAARGCWIKIGPESGPDTVFFKVDDGVMTFPLSAKGSPVTAYGTVRSMKDDKGQVLTKLEGTGAVVGK